MNNDFFLEIKPEKVIEIESYKNIIRKKNITIVMTGNIYDNNYNKKTIDEIYYLYIQYGKKVYKYLNGIFSLLIIDFVKNKFFIFQDKFGSNQNIYYYIKDKSILVSNQLKKIIAIEDRKWEFNSKAIKEFLKKGFITNKKTLVNELNKVPSGKYLELNLRNYTIKLKSNKHIINNKVKFIDNKEYHKTIVDICLNFKYNDVSAAISSGYDTNYLLYILDLYANNPIKAFCIGRNYW